VKRNLKPRAGDYVELLENVGGAPQPREQGFLIEDSLEGIGPCGVLFISHYNYHADYPYVYYCRPEQLKAIYRPRL